MPLYEYQCDACGNRFEKIVKFSDPPLETCPECGGAVQKLLSSPAIQFKGSGWYITDYAKKKSSADSKPSGSSDKGSTTSSETTKSESKSESKSDSAPASATTTPKTD
jgi:putative FmdB family regulatory protein